MPSAYPPFSDTKPLYDMSTFGGRLRHWTRALNPTLLLENPSSLAKAQQILDDHRQGRRGRATDAELWHARMAVESCVHPTTHEVISPWFRMSMFLPMNYVIVPAMMAPATLSSFYLTAGVQWANQSYNSAVNYCNRSSDKQPTSDIMKAYAATVVVAVGGNLCAAAWLRRIPPGTAAATVVRATMPFLAVAGAASANLALMRKNEWMSSGQGLLVKDEDGVARGTSVIAGRDSLYKCCMARVLWNIPCMVLPTVCAVPLRKFVPAARRNPYITEVLLQVVGLTAGVPPALAFYDVTQTLPADRLEPQFHGLKRRDGSPVKELTYYKGL
eukprot:gene10709-7440_t